MLHIRRRTALILGWTLVLLVMLVACTSGNSPESQSSYDQVNFMAGFKPQANLPFVGAYVAQEKGFFAEEGLNVDIGHVTSTGDNFRLLASNSIQITTADAAVVLQRRAGDPSLPIIAIALIGQRGQQGFAVLANSDIQTPMDWAGKIAGYKGTEPTPDYFAILEAVGLDLNDVEEQRVGFDPRALTSGEVDIYPVFISNEPDTLQRRGHEVKVFEATNYGVPTLGLTYITSESYLEKSPGIVERFLRAALKGISYAIDHPEETLDIVIQYAPLEERDHMRFMLDTELLAAQTPMTKENGIGWMTSEQWRSLHDLLVEYDSIDGPITNVTDAYSLDILHRVYADSTSR